MKPFGLIAFSVWCFAAPVAAQDTTHARHHGQQPCTGMMNHDVADMMPAMHEMMAPMLRVMAYTPQHLLARRDTLKLTNDQISKLTGIQNGAKSAHDAAAADMKPHMGAVSQAFQGAANLDTTALRAHFDASHAAMGKAHWSMVVAAAQARVLLTEAQRQKVEAWVTAAQQKMRGQHSM